MMTAILTSLDDDRIHKCGGNRDWEQGQKVYCIWMASEHCSGERIQKEQYASYLYDYGIFNTIQSWVLWVKPA